MLRSSSRLVSTSHEVASQRGKNNLTRRAFIGSRGADHPGPRNLNTLFSLHPHKIVWPPGVEKPVETGVGFPGPGSPPPGLAAYLTGALSLLAFHSFTFPPSHIGITQRDQVGNGVHVEQSLETDKFNLSVRLSCTHAPFWRFVLGEEGGGEQALFKSFTEKLLWLKCTQSPEVCSRPKRILVGPAPRDKCDKTTNPECLCFIISECGRCT